MTRLSLRRFLLPALLLVPLGVPLGAQSPVPKQVAAPPADILSGLVRLPDPADAARRSGAALLPVELVRAADGSGSFEVELSVDGAGDLTLVPLAPTAERWRLTVRPPDGRATSVDSLVAAGAATRQRGELAGLVPGVFADRFDVRSPRPGAWTIRVDVPSDAHAREPGAASRDGFLFVADGGSQRLVSHRTTHALYTHSTIGFVAQVEDGAGSRSSIDRAELRVRGPEGLLRLPMFDDGLHQDGFAGDGVFGAELTPVLSGDVFAQVVARGTSGDGAPFVRTTQHAFAVLEREAIFDGRAATAVRDELRLGIDLGLWLYADVDRLHVSAEVWGTDADGGKIPVAWLSRMAEPVAGAAGRFVSLDLDGRWLDLAGAGAPLELRRLRVQDPDTHVPFDVVERLALPVAALPPIVGSLPGPVTPQMTMGSPDGLTTADSLPGGVVVGRRQGLVKRGLMLVHGYCSSGVWPLAQFTGTLIDFMDYDQNRSHDDFAQLLLQAGVDRDSFGIVGHSQGGAAALHLYTYYFSGLDLASGSRRIQSVGSPYLGTPLAAELAGLGDIFGVGCGSNDDLSASGAALWLSGIPSWARDDVYYWTTSESGSSCNFLTNLFLSSPNDGVVERDNGQLAGGNNMGHVTGWCHTTGMSNPAQYQDSARNAEMNLQAAR